MTVDAAELVRIGDRPASFSVLLPAEPAGPVLLRVAEPLASVLERRYRSLATRSADVGTAALVVVDGRHHDVGAAAEALAPGGLLAELGAADAPVVYPDLDAPEVVWRPGWPVLSGAGPAARARRTAGLQRAVRTGRLGLRLVGPAAPSLAERIAGELDAALDGTFELVGVVAASRTILRVHADDGRQVSVRVSCTQPDLDLHRADEVLAALPDLGRWVPTVLAAGETAGCPWSATEWFGTTPWRRRARVNREVWDVAGAVTDVLASLTTGSTRPGWAGTWAARATMLGGTRLERAVSCLTSLEDGLPTGWCHGDLWPGNVLVHDRGAAVIDWDLATDDAPAGLDRVLTTAHRFATEQGGSVAAACRWTAEVAPGVVGEVAGRPWASWPAAYRRALAVAAWLVHLRNRSFQDLSPADLDSQLSQLLGDP